jgi:hypothetical protein
LDKLLRASAKGEFEAVAGAEKIGYHGKRAAFYLGKQEGRPVFFNYPSVDFGNLQIWVDFRIDNVEF